MAEGAGSGHDDRAGLAYRRCVGMVLVNAAGKVFMGWRNEKFPDRFNWQMPQGGIDKGEDPRSAAIRELYEETNVSSVTVIAESKAWLTYDLPPQVRGKALKGRFGGQRQKWFLLAFEGDENEINVLQPGDGQHRAEFSDWQWVDLKDSVGLVVPFKRHVYEAVVKEFAPLIEATAGSR